MSKDLPQQFQNSKEALRSSLREYFRDYLNGLPLELVETLTGGLMMAAENQFNEAEKRKIDDHYLIETPKSVKYWPPLHGEPPLRVVLTSEEEEQLQNSHLTLENGLQVFCVERAFKWATLSNNKGILTFSDEAAFIIFRALRSVDYLKGNIIGELKSSGSSSAAVERLDLIVSSQKGITDKALEAILPPLQQKRVLIINDLSDFTFEEICTQAKQRAKKQ